MTCIMTIFCFMSVISIISGFSCQIPATEKSLKLVYVLSVLSECGNNQLSSKELFVFMIDNHEPITTNGMQATSSR